MPRFIVAICDTNDGQIQSKINTTIDPVNAILSHPWIVEVYAANWINKNLRAHTAEDTIAAIWNLLSWSVECVNLDIAIMTELNDGDSNVSSAQTPLQ